MSELDFLQQLKPELAILLLFIIFGFGYKSLKTEIKEFKEEQEKKCHAHKQEGNNSFDKLERRIEEGFKTMFDRLEAQTHFLINLINEREKK